jgi:hypothetical protein
MYVICRNKSFKNLSWLAVFLLNISGRMNMRTNHSRRNLIQIRPGLLLLLHTSQKTFPIVEIDVRSIGS